MKLFAAQLRPRGRSGWLLMPVFALLCGCSHVSGWLPWHHKAPPAPEVATVLIPAGVGDAAPVPVGQFWDGNALRLDLGALNGAGSVQFTRAPRQAWPVRIEISVQPGSARQLEVSAAERVVFAMPAAGGALKFMLPPGTYGAKTQTLTISWEP